MTDLKERDLRQLSAYLDGELNPKEVSRLELRLKSDPELQKALFALDGTKKLVGSLPQVRPPRNFTLTPEMVGVRPQRNIFPVFRLATVMAAVAFAVLVGADAFLGTGMEFLSAPERSVDTVEVTIEVEAEKVVEAPLAVEAPVEEAAEPEMEAAQDTLGVEPSRAGISEETEVFVAEGAEPTGTESPVNKIELIPETTEIPPGEVLPYTTPTMIGEQAILETQPVSPSPQPTSIPALDLEPDVSRKAIDPLRVAEVGLGVLTVVLAVVTIILRRQR